MEALLEDLAHEKRMDGVATTPNVAVQALQQYTFGEKEARKSKGTGLTERMTRLKQRYQKEGMRRTAEAVLLCHAHGHPHVLLLQAGTNHFMLPGGRLRAGEEEAEGLARKLNRKLGPEQENRRVQWDIQLCLGTWWRPHFEKEMYPYVPPHITKPKEQRKIYLVQLPEQCAFAVPKNMKLLAVPLMELYGNAARYGPIISSVPHLLSQVNLQLN